MSNEIHGHEVMDAIVASRRLFTRATLTSFITERFGPEARFHTCSANGMSAAELVEFLARRGKFAGTEEGFTVDPKRTCSH